MTRRSLVIVKALVWAACLAPAVLLFARALGVQGLSLGANPVEAILDVCGKTGLNLLMFTLAVTPARRLTGLPWLLQLRRLLGLFAFFYLVLHFLTYAVLDLGLAWSTLLVDVVARPYITVGFTALVLLIPLAITSTRGWQRRLGRRWGKLHKLIYPIAILAVAHYWWQVKLDVADPFFYAAILTVLLGFRVKHWLDVRRARQASINAKPAVAAAYQGVEPPQPGHEPSGQRQS
jgi:sulfoxide reductase heme-binding subunit YedZ